MEKKTILGQFSVNPDGKRFISLGPVGSGWVRDRERSSKATMWQIFCVMSKDWGIGLGTWEAWEMLNTKCVCVGFKIGCCLNRERDSKEMVFTSYTTNKTTRLLLSLLCTFLPSHYSHALHDITFPNSFAPPPTPFFVALFFRIQKPQR